jgi:ABC-type phosphate transport system auxiliary subunit
MTRDADVHEKIAQLLRLPRRGSRAPSRERIEGTLTDGYAQALALEAERLRLERRLGEVARRADGADADDLAAQLAEISTRLAQADGNLSDLRRLLRSLRERHRDARSTAA